MDTTKLSSIISKLNFFKDIEKQDDLYKVIAIDDALNEFRRDNRLPWTIKKDTQKIFKGIEYYATKDGHDSLLNMENFDVEGYGDSASYLNTDLRQFIEEAKNGRNLLTQTYINGTSVLGLKNKEIDIPQFIIDSAGDVDNYSAVSNATKIGTSTVFSIDDSNSIVFNLTDTPATILNVYEETLTDDKYLEKTYIRRIYLKSAPTSVELRLQTDDTNYLSKVLTKQVNGLPFVENDFNYIGFPLEESDVVGTFDSSSIISSKIIVTGYTGLIYLGCDSLDEGALQQYWYYSKFAVMGDGETVPNKEQFLNYEENTYDINDSLVGPTKWIDPIIKKAREQMLLGAENEYLRNVVSKNSKKASDEFDRNFPNQEPKLTTVRVRFNNNPEEMNYVP